eukprot:scaffold7381_cov310-Pinguiococcus_pyrenoidosus.AAC.13
MQQILNSNSSAIVTNWEWPDRNWRATRGGGGGEGRCAQRGQKPFSSVVRKRACAAHPMAW